MSKSDKKKILIIHRTLNGGGAEKCLLNILTHINFQKFDITLFLVIKEGVYVPQIEKIVPIKYLFVGNGSKEYQSKGEIYDWIKHILYQGLKYFPFFTAFYINKFIIPEKYDKVVAFLEGYPTLLAAYRKEPKIAWIRIDLTKLRLLPKHKELWALKKMDKIICVSYDAKKSLLYLYPSLSDYVDVIYDPIHILDIRQKSKLYTINKPDGKFLFVGVGRLSDMKGYDLLILALGRLKKEGFDNFLLILVGEGICRALYESTIQDLGLGEHIELVGFKENPYPYIYAADAVIVSSRFEGFSLVTAESLVLKKSIIATRTNGPVELLQNGRYGILTDEISENALYEAIRRFMLYPVQFDYTGATEKFELNKIMEQVEVLFEA